MRRAGENDRNILCRYDPTEPGRYDISVKWSGVNVPNSPFEVNIFESHEKFRLFLRERGREIEDDDMQWREEIWNMSASIFVHAADCHSYVVHE